MSISPLSSNKENYVNNVPLERLRHETSKKIKTLYCKVIKGTHPHPCVEAIILWVRVQVAILKGKYEEGFCIGTDLFEKSLNNNKPFLASICASIVYCLYQLHATHYSEYYAEIGTEASHTTFQRSLNFYASPTIEQDSSL